MLGSKVGHYSTPTHWNKHMTKIFVIKDAFIFKIKKSNRLLTSNNLMEFKLEFENQSDSNI